MGISNLPQPGEDFRAKVGPGSFARKFSNAVRFGSLNNLQDNYEVIVDSVDDYEEYIRRGGLTRSLRWRIWLKIKKRSKNLTRDDQREIKQILRHLGK